jgi:hypothetical protein
MPKADFAGHHLAGRSTPLYNYGQRSTGEGNELYKLAQLWRGEVGLAQTYWLWNLLLGVILFASVFPAVFLAMAIGSRLPIFLWLALVPIQGVFMMVAVWRSAGNYQGPQVWRNLARVGCAIQVFQLIKFFVDLSTGNEELLSLPLK